MSCQLLWVSDCLVLTWSIPQHLFIFPSPYLPYLPVSQPSPLFPLLPLFPWSLQTTGARLKAEGCHPAVLLRRNWGITTLPFNWIVTHIDAKSSSSMTLSSTWICTRIIREKVHLKQRALRLAKIYSFTVLLIYLFSIYPCPICLQMGKFGDTPMIGHKLIGKARDLHYAYFGAGRNYGLHCLLCKVCTEFKENKVCKVCKECIQKNGSLAWVNFRSKLPHTLVGYCKIMGRAPLHLISFPIWQKIYVPGFILEGIRLLNIYLWRRSPKCQFRDLIRHSLLVFDLQ